MYHILLCMLALSVVSAEPTKTFRPAKRDNSGPPSQFVTTQDGQFFVNGSAFNFIGTNAYWLHTLNTDEDIDNTLGNISASGFKVVRTWAFNDVTVIPENGTWFQLIVNGTTSINNGTNGLPRLDKVVELAQKHGIYLLLSLTNNWNPLPLVDGSMPDSPLGLTPRDSTQGTNNSLPRNTLSNDYGGMDLYVRQFGDNHQHDQFYLNDTIINAFTNYTTQVVSRYVGSSAILGWEVANDPRCNSSLPSTARCTTTTVTSWHSRVAQHIKTVDPNHLISSGNQGFFCVDCPKLFPRVVTPPPRTSPAPGARRRSVPKPLSKSQILKDRKAAWKKTREVQKRSGQLPGGVRVRGRWVASPTRRQEDVGVGSSFDGSLGVDSEDILNIPEIGFGSFQLFPDQNSYGLDDPNLPAFNNTVQIGLDWIRRHAEAGRIFGKPVSLTGFGLVTMGNVPFFVPFNETVAPFAPDQAASTNSSQPFGVTDPERDDAYTQWIQASLEAGLQGVIQYQWGQGNLTAVNGTSITPSITGNGLSPDQDSTGLSPNDGYSIQDSDKESVVKTVQQASEQLAPGT